VTTSPDGQWVAAVTPDLALALHPLHGGKPKPVAKLAPREHPGIHLDVFGIDVRSGERKLWRTFDVPDPAGIRVSTFVMTRDARTYAYGYWRVLSELYLVESLR